MPETLKFEELEALLKDPAPLIVRKAVDNGIAYIRVYRGVVNALQGAQVSECIALGELLLDTQAPIDQFKKAFNAMAKMQEMKKRAGRMLPSWLGGGKDE